MRAVKRLLGLAAASALFAGVVEAQTCAGFPSFSAGKYNISGFFNLPEDATEFGGQFNWGMASGLYAGVHAGIFSPDVDGADDVTKFGATIGKSMSTAGGWNWCPMGTGTYGSTEGGNTLEILAGVGAGSEMGSAGSFMLAPYGMAGLHHFRVSADDCPPGFDCDTSDTGLGFEIGLGLRMANGLQITPKITFSTIEGSDSVIGVRVSWPLGGGMM